MKKPLCRSFLFALAAAALLVMPAQAQTSPPDLSVCDGIDCQSLENSICDPGGFKVTLTSYTAPGGLNQTGNAIYTYEICNPAEGTCSLNAGRSCLSNDDCGKHGDGTCSRECAVDSFRGLSHFNIAFPELGGIGSCLSDTTMITGSCACTAGSSGACSVGGFVLGDGSCDQDNVAKCDDTNLPVGDCIEMTLNIPGDANGPGLGAAIVVSKESQDCNASCMAGPSCDDCDTPPGGGGGDCLTRTLGFWGTHPWHTNDYDDGITVCGEPVGCNDVGDGTSDPACGHGSCDDIMEALGSASGELKHNSAYISMNKQLAAAKLNLNATDALLDGAFCEDWEYNGKDIYGWIDYCENLCNKSQSQISESGCIEALDEFNNSTDVLPGGVTPTPFDRPPVDDYDNISGADPTNFNAAKQNGVVVGKNVPGGTNCNN